MKATFLLNRHDFKKHEKNKQKEFIMLVLSSMGITDEEISICFTEEDTVDSRYNFRELLLKYNLDVIDDRDGNIKVYLDSSLIAEWKKATFVYKEDIQVINPNDRIYIEMLVDYWIFEEG